MHVSLTAFVLKPGEYKVSFSPSSQTLWPQKHEIIRSAWSLQEGFVAGGKGGGSFERYIAVDKDYGGLRPMAGRCRVPLSTDTCQLWRYARSGSAVLQKLTETPAFSETNDEEIVAYLKTFQGDGGRASLPSTTDLQTYQNDLNANRVQVGAIEIDLTDSDLQSRLPSYAVDEMAQLMIDPRLRVS